MPPRERPVDRGTARGRKIIAERGLELRAARVDRGLTLADVAKATRMSTSKLSRIERGLAGSLTLMDLARLHAVVGLEVSVRAFPGGTPIRDLAQAALLRRLRDRLHGSIRWSIEVPLPLPGDQRAWDAVLTRLGQSGTAEWRFGVEAETAPHDVQALARRLSLKARDGALDGVILVLPATRGTRRFLREAGALLSADFPVAGVRALEALAAGTAPPGNAIVVI
jgi:transcriptional regulator with XRE-family HTH domain